MRKFDNKQKTKQASNKNKVLRTFFYIELYKFYLLKLCVWYDFYTVSVWSKLVFKFDTSVDITVDILHIIMFEKLTHKNGDVNNFETY